MTAPLDIKRFALSLTVAQAERLGVRFKLPEIDEPLTDAEREAAHVALDNAELGVSDWCEQHEGVSRAQYNAEEDAPDEPV